MDIERSFAPGSSPAGRLLADIATHVDEFVAGEAI